MKTTLECVKLHFVIFNPVPMYGKAIKPLAIKPILVRMEYFCPSFVSVFLY